MLLSLYKYSFSRKGKPMAKMESAYFAGGCFWCITPTFKETPGVSAVISGYAGGDLQNPTYKDVKTQKSGHRETIKIDFDSETVSFDELFSVFLCSVNPFDEGGQFIDRGFSYTLAVYYTSEEQKETAAKAIHDLEQLAMSYPGVTKTYAIQAGRELRVIVGADKIDDKQTEKLSGEIATRIQNEMTYPGQVKITVIRETRSVAYAK